MKTNLKVRIIPEDEDNDDDDDMKITLGASDLLDRQTAITFCGRSQKELALGQKKNDFTLSTKRLATL
ncbi:unnamed protein product [Euphydryas editha]|uniref:Uncharacterized protein n=1 Tax=Euphydryas editha TaxID=104508 RepID=A0AAU9VBL2_EUPED|nr:unnamed protein product [Euphydryas editha]